MLNLSDNSIRQLIDTEQLASYQRLKFGRFHFSFRKIILIFSGIFVIFLLLPWTQNIQTQGRLTTLKPEHRPQTIHATISGRIEKWYVSEGQSVKKGDTIVYLSEVKTDYFDPNLVGRTGEQVAAKTQSIEAYSQKVGALENQILAMQAELVNKTEQIRNKIIQSNLKVASEQAELDRINLDKKVAERQLDGTKNLYEKGLKSLTELEEKKLKIQEIRAKLVSAENKLDISRSELENAKSGIDFDQK